MASEKLQMSREDWIKLAKGAGLAAGGAILTYLSAFVAGADFGVYTPIVVSAWAVILNFLRKYIPAQK